MSFWSIPKLFHVDDENIWNFIDEVFETLKLIFACIAFHLHALSLVMELDAGLEGHKLILPGVLDVA